MGYTEQGLWQDDPGAERDERIGDHEFYATVYDQANTRYMGNHVPWDETLSVFVRTYQNNPKELVELLKNRFRVVARCHCDPAAYGGDEWSGIRREVIQNAEEINFAETEKALIQEWQRHVESEQAGIAELHAAAAKRRANGWLVGIDQLTALDPMERFGAIRTARAALDAVEVEAVVAARRAGKSWTEVGVQMGMTKQSAHERFAKHDPQGEAA